MFKTFILATIFACSAFANEIPCKSDLAGKKLTCNVTYDLQSASVLALSSSQPFMMSNSDEPSIPEDGQCQASLGIQDKVSGLLFYVSADESSIVTISSYLEGILLSPEVAASVSNGAKVEAYYNYNRNPKTDGRGQTVYGFHISCAIQN